MLADSHIHLSHVSFEGDFPYLNYNGTDFVLENDGTRDQLIDSMKAVGIAFCVEPAVELDSNERLLALAENLPGFLYPAVGVHPTRTYQYTTVDERDRRVTKRLKQKDFRLLEQYAQNPAVVAIGETGLDYHRERREQHRLVQKVWFVRQLLLAHRQNLPVVLHIRQADRDALWILRLFRHQLHGGVVHCFCGNGETAKAYTGLGLMLGIGGSLLQAPALCADLEEAVRSTPIESLLLETDGPYVKPVCPLLTGKQRKRARNTSLILPAVARRIAELKDMTQEDVERITTANTLRLFGRKGHPVQREEAAD